MYVIFEKYIHIKLFVLERNLRIFVGFDYGKIESIKIKGKSLSKIFN